MAHSAWTGGSVYTGQAALPHKNIHTMTYWIRKLKREEESAGDAGPVFAKLPSEAEIAMRDTAENSAAVSIYISGCIRIETAPSCPPELFRVLVRTLKENA